jgi:hypothetical protein
VDLSSLIPGSAMGYVNLVGIIVAVASIGAASISKYTANKTDDMIAGWLAKAHDLLGLVGLQPTLEDKRQSSTYSPATGGKTVRVVDHRSAPPKAR